MQTSLVAMDGTPPTTHVEKPRPLPSLRQTDIICFGSGTTLRELSNLSSALMLMKWPSEPWVPAHLVGKEGWYASAEHAYQCLVCSEDAGSAKQFEVGGSVSMAGVYDSFPQYVPGGEKGAKSNPRNYVPKCMDSKRKHWEKLKCVGIAPKVVSNMPPLVAKAFYRVNINARKTRIDERHSFKVQLSIWRPILKAKFTQNPGHFKQLKQTKGRLLVEFGRFRNPNQYWSAFVEKPTEPNGCICLFGRNVMGRILTKVRDEMMTMAE